MLFETSENSVKTAKKYISKELIGQYGITSTATYYNNDKNRYEVFVGVEEENQISDVS